MRLLYTIEPYRYTMQRQRQQKVMLESLSLEAISLEAVSKTHTGSFGSNQFFGYPAIGCL
ncbi:hypothetical protein [Egbenema bharatensis]|uniref:hypothetical protein n=1 Tax=Egbenema bharatensis TaxID=3463334 RepID=UPI003A83CE00